MSDDVRLIGTGKLSTEGRFEGYESGWDWSVIDAKGRRHDINDPSGEINARFYGEIREHLPIGHEEMVMDPVEGVDRRDYFFAVELDEFRELRRAREVLRDYFGLDFGNSGF